jgi:hypothetical protein
MMTRQQLRGVLMAALLFVGASLTSACEESCRDLLICKKYGQCTEIDGKCWATSAKDCRASSNCAQYKQCKLRERKCRRF